MTPKCRTIEINSKEVNPYVFFLLQKDPKVFQFCVCLWTWDSVQEGSKQF